MLRSSVGKKSFLDSQSLAFSSWSLIAMIEFEFDLMLRLLNFNSSLSFVNLRLRLLIEIVELEPSNILRIQI